MEFDKSKVYTTLNADELKVGSKVILANYLESLKYQVEANSWPTYTKELTGIMGTSSTNRFKAGDKTYNLAYLVSGPKEKKWIVYLNREIQFDGKDCYLTACREDRWESVQKDYGAKTKLFIGSESEVLEWFKARQKFAEVIKAWEDGKELQFRPRDPHLSWQECGNPSWDVDLEYRVKPECPCEDGIDSKACAGCPQDEERKQTVRPFKDCDELVEFWSLNYQSVMRPTFTKPLIWVRLKVDKRERLIVAYGDNFVEIGNKTKAVTLQHLFEQYEFLDGSPCGMEVKE